MILLGIFLLGTMYGSSQSEYFPAVGDTLYFLVDRMPDNITINDHNRHSRWDISMAKAPYLRPVVPVNPGDAAGSSHFPDADYAMRMEDRTIHFYKKEGKELYMLGQYGFYIFQQYIPTIVRFDYPFIVNYPSAQYGQKWEYNSQAVVEFSVAELKPTFVSKLPVRADSVRIVMNIDRLTTRDAEGQLNYEIISDDVLRHFTIEQYQYQVLLRIGEKPWQDFSEYVNYEELFGPLVQYRYDFLTDKHGIPVASVWMNRQNGKPTRIKYWVRSYLHRFRRIDELTEPDIYAFPNPAIGYVNIELNNLRPGQYKIALYNFLAQEVFQMPVKVEADETVRIDITEFDKGPYLYALIDQYGRRIITKRLTIMKP